jgi:polar amino acid transport system substrate-binding protein
VLTVANQLDCLVRVQLGLADAVFTDNALAAGQAAQDPSMHLVGVPVTHEPYGVAMKQGRPDLVRRVNQILAGYEAGGRSSQWARSYHTWLSTDLPGISGPPPLTYKKEQ